MPKIYQLFSSTHVYHQVMYDYFFVYYVSDKYLPKIKNDVTFYY